jgi:hypothetical protein
VPQRSLPDSRFEFDDVARRSEVLDASQTAPCGGAEVEQRDAVDAVVDLSMDGDAQSSALCICEIADED